MCRVMELVLEKGLHIVSVVYVRSFFLLFDLIESHSD